MARGVLHPAMVERQIKRLPDVPEGVKLASKMTAARLPVDIVEVLDAMPQKERVALIRSAITEAALKQWPSDRPIPDWVEAMRNE